MSKQAYYDMCVQLNIEPDENAIPIEYNDLSNQTKDALNIFEYCSDRWDSTNGSYLGKDLNNIEFLFGLLKIHECYWLVIINILNIIINYRVKSVNRKIQNKAKVKK